MQTDARPVLAEYEGTLQPVAAHGNWLPWVPVALAIALSAVEFVVSLQDGQTAHHAVRALDLIFAVEVVIPPVAFTTVGAIVVTRRPGNQIGRLMIAVGLGFAVNVFALDYPGVNAQTHQTTRPVGDFVVWLSTWSAALYLVPLVILLLLFPTGQLTSHRWKPVLWTGVIAWVGAAGAAAVRAGPIDSVPMDNPFGVVAVPDALTSVLSLGGFAAMAGAACSLCLRFRSARNGVRQQLKWFTFAAAIAIALDIATAFTTWTVLAVPALAATAAVPVCMGIAILRYSLYDIDLIISRTLVYGGLSLGVITVYVAVVGYFTDLLHVGNAAIPSLLVTALVAVAFQPARAWLQQHVNRFMFGERDNPYTVLARLGERFAGAFDPNQVLPTLVTTVADSLKLPYVAMIIEGQESVENGAAAGVPVGEITSFPLVYQGELVGHLLVCARRGEASITDADRDLLLHLAQRAGVAVHGVRLTRHLEHLSADLHRSRERLVLAREEERSRLRRDLHDELAPRLAGLSLSAGTIAQMVRRDPERAEERARDLERSIRGAVGEIRQLVYNLRPPTLDDLGLLAAIGERAAQFGTPRPGSGTLTISTELPSALPPLPAAVEVAVYRIVQEALMNVERHAFARRCSIHLRVMDNMLDLEITDDGIGVPEEYQRGIGLRSIQERAEELGGQFAVGSTDEGGTRLAVSLPLARVIDA